MGRPLKVLIVDDSTVVRDYLTYIIASEPDMHIVGTAKNGKEAIKLASLKKPDVITMDINMPVMNGFEATNRIMELTPTPIVIVTSSYDKNNIDKTFNSFDAGALAILAKPEGFKHPDFKKSRAKLVNTVRAMSEVKVVRRRSKYKKKNDAITEKPRSVAFSENHTNFKITAIGVSTGGPQALSTLLPLIPENYNMPIVVVQHIANGFLEGLVEWLGKTTKLNVKIAENGEYLEKGNIYFCPADTNIGINKSLRVELKDEVSFYTIKPSVSHLFRTVGNNFKQEGIGVLLTGMGEDGAEELAMMKEAGAVTIVQDKESCVVFGMPGKAVKLGAHKYILSPENIAKKLIEINRHSIG